MSTTKEKWVVSRREEELRDLLKKKKKVPY